MKKISSILMLMIFWVFLSVLPAYAFDCGLTTPASSGTLGALGLINFSFSDIGITEASVTCYINASSPSTANSSIATFVTSAANETKATNMPLNIVNMTFPASTILEDSSDYTFRGSCQNSTARITCNATRTNVIVDRTTPSAPTSLTTAKRLDGNTITATVTGTDTTKCTLSFGLGSIRNAMTHSGNTCTYTVSRDNPSDGIYDYRVYATDGKDETASAVTSVEIDATDNPARRSPSSLNMAEPVANVVSSGGGFNIQTIIKIALVVAVIDLVLGLEWIFKKK